MKHVKETVFLLFWCGMALISSGCAVHTAGPVRPGISIPAEFRSESIAGAPVSEASRWWEAFNDPELNNLVARALDENLDIARSLAVLKQIEAVARGANAARGPQVNLSGNAGRSKEPDLMGGTLTGRSYTLSVAASFELDIWQRLKSGATARGFEAAASMEDLKGVYMTISAQVADFYYLLVEQRAQLNLLDHTITTRTENLDLVKLRYREGLASPIDLYQARQNLAAAKARRPGVVARLATAAHALSVLVGQYPETAIGGELSIVPDLPAAFPEGLPSQLLVNRPDIQSALLLVSAADQDLGAAVADRFPAFNLLAALGRTGTDFGTDISHTIWQVAGEMMMPLIDWGGRKAEVQRNQAVFEERLAAYSQTVLTAFKEVEDALVNNRAAMETIEGFTIEASAAESALSLAVERYTNGVCEYLPVLDAQTRHFDAESRLLAAKRDLMSNRITLARALGGNWMAEQIRQRRPGSEPHSRVK